MRIILINFMNMNNRIVSLAYNFKQRDSDRRYTCLQTSIESILSNWLPNVNPFWPHSSTNRFWLYFHIRIIGPFMLLFTWIKFVIFSAINNTGLQSNICCSSLTTCCFCCSFLSSFKSHDSIRHSTRIEWELDTMKKKKYLKSKPNTH